MRVDTKSSARWQSVSDRPQFLGKQAEVTRDRARPRSTELCSSALQSDPQEESPSSGVSNSKMSSGNGEEGSDGQELPS